MRYAAHGEIDLIGRRLSVPVDLNIFTDRDRDGARKLGPTELDGIIGLTSTWEMGPGALEVGTRFEHDRPVDRAGARLTYVDARARYLYSLAAAFPGLAPALRDGDVSGWVTLGWFAHNPTYFASGHSPSTALTRRRSRGEDRSFRRERGLVWQSLAMTTVAEITGPSPIDGAA